MNISEPFRCSKGLLIPTSAEAQWPTSLRVFLYLVALLYSFLGIAIIADVFMCAIECITSATRKVRIARKSIDVDDETSNKKVLYKEVRIWNPTVANLSLMALGSSAPEILLTIIELIGNKFEAGELGPGTIVGSAAFNLMVIHAICITALPKGESKRIKKISVFCVTAFWNVFAYLWLLVILLGTSKNEIEIWEGALTFAMFFFLILSAYVCDKCHNKFNFKREKISPSPLPLPQMPVSDIQIIITDAIDEPVVVDESIAPQHPEWREVEKQARLDFPNTSDEELAKIVALKIHADRPKHYLEHRIDAIRKISKSSIKDSYSERSDTIIADKESSKMIKIEFACRVYCIDPENDKEIQLKIVRHGPVQKKVTFHYETVSGMAKEKTHFIRSSENMVMRYGEREKIITITIVNSAEWKPYDIFTVKLELDESEKNEKVKIGKCNPAEIVYICNEDDFQSRSCEVEFVKHCVSAKFGQDYVRLPIVRKGDSKEKVTVEWITQAMNDKANKDFEGYLGKTTFEAREMETYIDIPLVDNALVEKQKMFLVKLLNPSENAFIGQNSVTIVNNDGLTRMFNKLDTLVPKILRTLEPGKQSWLEQFYQNLNVNGGDAFNATVVDYLGHIISFPWKASCALIPPPIYFGGWVTFLVALAFLGIVVALVIDIASTFGCLIGLDNTVTAITFVALGASLPDTFASRIAAKQDKSADSAVGNITGSNSVNVFLGLGMPWFVASIYWAAKGKKFIVQAGDIGFCVTVYSVCAIATIALLFARRYLPIFGKTELGGPNIAKWASAVVLVLLWVLYILVSSFHEYRYIPSKF